MKLIDIINEIHLEKGKWEMIPHSEIDAYEQRILDLIKRTYAPLGGHPNFNSTRDIHSPEHDYEVLDSDGDEQPEATSVSKDTRAGTKLVASAHDGSKEAVKSLIRHKIELLNKEGYFAEVSGKLLDILLHHGVGVVNDKDVVERALVGKRIEWHGDGTYTRDIGGKSYKKVMVGKPKA